MSNSDSDEIGNEDLNDMVSSEDGAGKDLVKGDKDDGSHKWKSLNFFNIIIEIRCWILI